jgi:hypothetical protein
VVETDEELEDAALLGQATLAKMAKKETAESAKPEETPTTSSTEAESAKPEEAPTASSTETKTETS